MVLPSICLGVQREERLGSWSQQLASTADTGNFQHSDHQGYRRGTTKSENREGKTSDANRREREREPSVKTRFSKDMMSGRVIDGPGRVQTVSNRCRYSEERQRKILEFRSL